MRLSNAMAYLNKKIVTEEWIKTNIHHLEITKELKKLKRKIQSESKTIVKQ
jgi:hypothetical protein